MTTTTIGAGSDTLALGITEDFYQDYAQFTVGLDGQQVGGTLTATSLHEGFSSDTVNVLADLAPGVHTVTVNFLNDAYGGTADTDRNLYVEGATYDGTFVPSAARELQVGGPVTFGVLDSTPAPAAGTTTTVGSGSDLLVLDVSQDAYQGNAQFTVSLDGQQVGDVLTASSLHGSGASDTVNVFANLSSGPHTVTVNFLNDAYGGTPDTDRNLYVDGATFNGAAVSGASASLLSAGPASFDLTDPGTVFVWDGGPEPQPDVNRGDTLVLTGGTFTAQGEQLSGVAVYLNGATQSSPAHLSVQDGSVGSLRLTSFSDPTRYSSFGDLDVTGNVTVESPLSWGGRVAPGSLAVTLNGPATLNLNGGNLSRAASFVVNGSPGSTVTNTGTLALSSVNQFAIHADLAGAGTIRSVPDYDSFGVEIELDGAVSAAQTVELDGGTLQLDQPMGFMGTVSGFITSQPGGPASTLQLEHTTVTGTSFQQLTDGDGDLSIFTQDQGTGAAGTDIIHVAGTFAPNAFVFTNDPATQSASVRLAPLQPTTT